MSEVRERDERTARAVRALLSILVCLWFVASLIGGTSPPAHAQEYGVPHAGDYPTQVDPWEIIIYEHRDFTGNWIRYKMEPGMRQKLVPQIYPGWESKVTSIQVGSKVAVTLYAGHDFSFWGTGNEQTETTFGDSVAQVRVDYQVNSFIVYPKAAGAPLGVWLADERFTSFDFTFFPLPEMEGELQAGWPLGQFNLDKNANDIWLPRGVVSIDSIQAVFYDQQGNTLILPPAAGWNQLGLDGGWVFKMINLGQLNWSDRAVSLVVKWTGPPLNLGPPVVPVTLPTISAPPSSFNYIQGKDLPGQNYKTFMMKGDYGECARACDGDPQCRAFTWVKPGVKGGDAACCLKSGVPVATQDPNCMSGVRTDVVQKTYDAKSKDISGPKNYSASAAQKFASAIATASKIPDVSGSWKSSIGIVYDVSQNGNQFEWTVAKTNEKAQGTVQGAAVSASWSGPQGSGTSTGQITATDANGRATQIDWKNGVRFYR